MLLVINSYIDAIQLYTISKVKSPKKKNPFKKSSNENRTNTSG